MSIDIAQKFPQTIVIVAVARRVVGKLIFPLGQLLPLA